MKKLATTIIFIFVAGLVFAMNCLVLTRLNVDNEILPLSIPLPSAEMLFINKQLVSMTLRQKVASLLILHKSGSDVATLQNYLQVYQPGGLIFMGDNIPSTTNDLTIITSQLQTNPELPYLFAIDGEGGIVNRLPDDIYSAAADLKSQPTSATESAFRGRSVLLKRFGINLNFGIVADVTDDSNSFIYQRAFGGDPVTVGERVVSAVNGANGLTLSTLKHFPGHGETESDSHTSIPVTDVSYERWQQQDEPPFVSGIKAGAQVVMFGHLIYSSVDSAPASLSAKWHQILKERDNFESISITDDMVMLQQSGDSNYADPVANSISALQAGSTMLLFVLDHGGDSNIDPNVLIDGIVAAVDNSTLSKTVINNNVRQVLTLRHNLPTMLTKI